VNPFDEGNLGLRVSTPAFWTAPAKRSGDGAFFEVIRDSREAELKQSGVALRFPPHSKMSPTPGDLG
jgi:hypothetical protein